MTANPSEIGAPAKREVAYAPSRVGFDIYVPMFMPHSRVDFIAARAGALLRVQVKSARLVRGVVTFHACSNTANNPKAYSGEVDAFGVYSPGLDRSYLVPIEDFPTRVGSLRAVATKNNQVAGIRWAKDYLIGPAT